MNEILYFRPYLGWAVLFQRLLIYLCVFVHVCVNICIWGYIMWCRSI